MLSTSIKAGLKLVSAAITGNIEDVRAALNGNPSQALIDDALMTATGYGHMHIIQLLIDAGANVDTYRLGETVLIKAVRYGHMPIVQALLHAGADASAKTSVNGLTTLMWAIYKNYPPVVYALIDNNVDIEARSFWGSTAFSLAINSDNPIEMLTAVICRGATVQEALYSPSIQQAIDQALHHRELLSGAVGPLSKIIYSEVTCLPNALVDIIAQYATPQIKDIYKNTALLVSLDNAIHSHRDNRLKRKHTGVDEDKSAKACRQETPG